MCVSFPQYVTVMCRCRSCEGHPGFPMSKNRLEKLKAVDKIISTDLIYVHAQEFVMNDELLLTILKVSVPQQVNK